jgi:ProP effector
MSNPSLKDQLKALSMELSSGVEPDQKAKAPPAKSQHRERHATNHSSHANHAGKRDRADHKPRYSKKPAGAPAEKITKSKPAWLEQAQYGVELLKAHFPSCFREFKDIAPLKIGIKQDLAKHLSTCEDIVIGDKACMITSLAYYVNSMAYHKSMVPGAARIDLQGQPAGEVNAEEAQYSHDCRKAKIDKKNAAPTNVTTPAEPTPINE